MEPKPLTRLQEFALAALTLTAKEIKEDLNTWAIAKLPNKTAHYAWLMSTIRELSKDLDGLVVEDGNVFHMSKEVYDLGEAFRFDPKTDEQVVILAISAMIDNQLQGI
jgi:hypothetical protein